MELAVGFTVTTSAPSGVPVNDKPNVYTLPLADILDGVAFTVALPPLNDKVKSFAANAPLPPFVLNTASLIVTAMVLLSAARDNELIVGGNPSVIVAVLLLCDVLASFPATS